MSDALIEVQVDGLSGPTHHFGGLSPGNLASTAHAHKPAHPRAAALQGLEKMRRVLHCGVAQAWLPPLLRPDLTFLRSAGLSGTDAEVLTLAAQEPHLLHIAISSAFMWAANCATVIPTGDSGDNTCHILVANLQAMAHRTLEGTQRAAQLRRLFAQVPALRIHAPLPSSVVFGDEGAANHSRIACDGQVTHIFVHGRSAAALTTTRFPARQTSEASRALVRLAQVKNACHILQSAQAIDAGAFHNDVVMVGCDDRVLLHEYAWAQQSDMLEQLRKRHPSLRIAEISAQELSLNHAVHSYLFNSQLLHTTAGYILIAPQQAEHGPARAVINRLLAEQFIAQVHFIELNESMANGGGPACLRLRVPLTPAQVARCPAGFLLTDARIDALEHIVEAHYPTHLSLSDLVDPAWIALSLRLESLFHHALFDTSA
jgi:succinylarginine dihydrolase